VKGVVFTGNRNCEVRNVPVPTPGHGEVLVRIGATGICGSDLHVYRAATASDQVRGHEPCGTVAALGPGVRRLRLGDRVTVFHHQGCGVCRECARGDPVWCSDKRLFGVTIPGSFAEYTVAMERNCIPMPAGMSFADGAFIACVGGTAYGALKRLDARPHEFLAVFGLGPVGLSCILVGRNLGLNVIGVDVVSERVELARKCGAAAAVNATEQDPVAAIEQFCGGCGADCLIETSGSAAGRRNILPSLRRGGRAAIVGVGSDEEVINPTHIHGKAATLVGSVVFPLAWAWELVGLCDRAGLSFEPAVTHRFPLVEAPAALRLADSGRCGKVLFVPQAD